MILDDEDILTRKTREVANIPNIVYNMFDDKLSYDDRLKCTTKAFECIKSYCNLPDLINYQVINFSSVFRNYFILDAFGADMCLIEIFKQNKRLVFSFYTDCEPNYIKQLKYYGLTIEQYNQIKSKLIELFNLEECYDISEISFYSINYISKYDIR